MLRLTQAGTTPIGQPRMEVYASPLARTRRPAVFQPVCEDEG